MRVFYRSRVDDYYIDYIGLSEYWGCYIYILGIQFDVQASMTCSFDFKDL